MAEKGIDKDKDKDKDKDTVQSLTHHYEKPSTAPQQTPPTPNITSRKMKAGTNPQGHETVPSGRS